METLLLGNSALIQGLGHLTVTPKKQSQNDCSINELLHSGTPGKEILHSVQRPVDCPTVGRTPLGVGVCRGRGELLVGGVSRGSSPSRMLCARRRTYKEAGKQPHGAARDPGCEAEQQQPSQTHVQPSSRDLRASWDPGGRGAAQGRQEASPLRREGGTTTIHGAFTPH